MIDPSRMNPTAAACLTAVLSVLVACGDETVEPAPPEVVMAAPPLTREGMIELSDRREAPESLRRAATSGEPARRRRAVLGLANLHEPTRFPDLAISLRDTDPGVRDAASMGIGGLGTAAPDEASRVLIGALATESDPALRPARVRDLGRLATDEAVTALEAVLAGDSAEERAAACLGLAERGLVGRTVSSATVRRMSSLLAPGEPVEVRVDCAYALGRLPAPTDAAGQETLAVGLGLALVDVDPDVRRFAARALMGLPSSDLALLVNATRDPDWQVAVQAHRAVAARLAGAEDAAPSIAVLLRAAANQLLDDEGGVRSGGPLHVFLSAVEGANPHARAGPVYDLAAELHTRLETRGTASRDHALAHCAVAALMDRGRGWPSRITQCGGDVVSETERGVLEAQILGDLEGAEPQRMVRLRRLFARETPRIREAALASAAKLLVPEAITLILEGLRVDDPGVRAEALTALASVARRRPTAEIVPPPVPVEAALDGLAAVRAATPDDELETLVTWIDTVEALDGRRFTPELGTLAHHPNHAVRTAARARLLSFEEPIPAGAIPPLENAMVAADLSPADAHPSVELETSRGRIVISLRPDLAPTTVARFLGLVRDGFFDGLTFHRVVAAFVVQGGDPRGDGYGGPGWSQRCEDSRLPFERGTVGMALAGRDTGGSQFFITQSRHPHLDGRYTAFGRVTEGIELVDTFQPEDRIEEARIVSL